MPFSPQAVADHQRIPQERFMGLYSRGVSDSVPDAYFIDSRNNKFDESEVSTRDGSVKVVPKNNIVRFFKYKRLGETPRYIMLDSSGNLFDSLFPLNPIWSDATMVDFSCVNYSNRLYITPHNRVRGIPGKYVIVYQGGGPTTARLAGGTPPTSFTMAAADGAAGSVEEGIHLIAVCYQTDTGYITAPCAENLFVVFNASGGFKINLTGVPVSPDSFVSKRVILATKSIPVSLFDGNLLGYEFFFVPDGTINNNSATTFTIDFFDADLLDSADYLLDNMNNIPAGVGIANYAGRILVWCANGEEHTIRISNFQDPETFNSASGLFSVDPSESASGIKNCFEFRKNLIIAKSNRSYITGDNGDDPSTWSLTALDPSVGTECFGIGRVLDVRSGTSDRVFVADQSGLLEFNGVFRRPELTWNIEGIWKRINKAYFNLVQVDVDSVYHRFFISVPLDGATAISHVIYGDFSKAFTVYDTIDEKSIKWDLWTFPSAPTSIVADSDSVDFTPVFEYSLSDGVYDVKSGNTTDNGTAIAAYFKTSLKTAAGGYVNHFGYLKLRVVGSGTLSIQVQGEDASNTQNPPSLTLSSSPGYELDRLFNFLNEKCSVQFGTVNAGDKYTVSRFDLWAKPVWLRRASG